MLQVIIYSLHELHYECGEYTIGKGERRYDEIVDHVIV